MLIIYYIIPNLVVTLRIKSSQYHLRKKIIGSKKFTSQIVHCAIILYKLQ